MEMEKLVALVESIKVMPLQPDDIIVIRVGAVIDNYVAARIRDHFRSIVGDRKVIVHGPDVELEIMRPEAATA